MKKLILVLFILSLSACSRNSTVELEQKTMFTLHYGALDDELTPLSTSKIAMNDGFFYIIDSSLGKLMRFNSYGDLLLLQYNEEKNPAPILVHKNGADTPSNKAAVPFPYREPSQIAVNSGQYFFVADILSDSDNIWSDEFSCMLTSTVYCFDPQGKLICSLGQDGPGSIPFPRITKLETTFDNCLAVHTLTPKGQMIYIFNNQYQLLYSVLADTSILPPDETSNRIASLDSISVSQKGMQLFIKTDYYTENKEDIDFYKSTINCYDLEQKKCIWSIDIPKAETLYQLLGVYGEDQIYMVSPEDNGTYTLLILDGNRSVAVNTPLALGQRDIRLMELSLGSHGIITALVSYEDDVASVWWRSDRLLKDIEKTD